MNDQKFTGKLIVFEGMDGSGKTTQAAKLAEFLTAKGFDVIATKEPGGTVLANKIRSLALENVEGEEIEPLAELYLMSAARAQHVKNVIVPALLSGKIVICDRFIASTIAYQGQGRGLFNQSMNAIKDILVYYGMFSHSTFMHSIYLDVTLDTSNDRLAKRVDVKNTNQLIDTVNNRLDAETQAFKKRVLESFKWWAGNYPNIIRINGQDSEHGVTKLIQDWAVTKFIPDNVYLIKDTEHAE